MKNLIFALLFISLPVSAQIDWGRALVGAYKAGKAYTMSDADFQEYVKGQVALMDAQAKVAPASNKYAVRLKKLCAGLNTADGLKLNFKVYITSGVNAFACPDGSVRVFSALMDMLNDNELLGVLGHEIGHVALKHSYKAWKDAMYRSAVDDAAAAVSSKYARISNSVLGDLSGSAISAKHSKVHENQADDYGYTFLKKHGKNPWAMAIAFEKMKKLSGSKQSRLQKWLNVFSSHPDFDTRIKRMSDKAKADGYKRPK